jgi:hypothetical protein
MLREEGKERRKREILSCDINFPFPIISIPVAPSVLVDC